MEGKERDCRIRVDMNMMRDAWVVVRKLIRSDRIGLDWIDGLLAS